MERLTKSGKNYNNALARLAKIENILGDNYDLDHLQELVTASREHRVVVLDKRCRIIKTGRNKRGM